MEGITCRHCGRTIAVPASNCPWCNATIMVICSACRQYTDDQEPVCQHCGSPLVPDDMADVRSKVGLDKDLAQIVEDRERAQIIASGVVARDLPGFFFNDGERQTVLVDLFGAPPDHRREAAALLFVAAVYLLQKAYCALEPGSEEKALRWAELRPWEGQVRSLEGALARCAGFQLTFRQAVDQTIREEMDFRFEKVKPPRLRAPGAPQQPIIRDLSARTATVAVIERARQAELPQHDEKDSRREIYQLVLTFVRAEPQRARYLAEQILEVLDWFRRYEEDPAIALLR